MGQTFNCCVSVEIKLSFQILHTKEEKDNFEQDYFSK